MGARLGDRLLPAVEGENPKGFWEDIDVYQLDCEILAAVGSDWHRLAELHEARCAALENTDFPSRASRLLEDRASGGDLFAFKDPRVSRLLPFWKRRFKEGGFDVRYLVALRSPLAVARSLADRNGFDLRKGALLWLDTMLSILRGISHEHFVVVDYDLMLRDPRVQLRRAADALDLMLDENAILQYETDFLDQGLRHHLPALDASFLELCPPILAEVYAHFRALAERGADHGLPPVPAQQLERWIVSYRQIRPALELLDRAEQAADELLGNLGVRELTITEQCSTIAARDAALSALESALAERDNRLAERDAVIAARDVALAERDQLVSEARANLAHAHLRIEALARETEVLTSEVERRHGEAVALSEERDRLAQDILDARASFTMLSGQYEAEFAEGVKLQQRIRDLEGDVERLGHKLAESCARVDALGNALSDEHKTVSALLSSTSWKITRPLRALREAAARVAAVLRGVIRAP